MRLENIDIQTIDCAMQHINVFLSQACKEEKANFAEPCSLCQYVSQCDFDWMGHLAPLLNVSNIAIQLRYKEKKKGDFYERFNPDGARSP